MEIRKHFEINKHENTVCQFVGCSKTYIYNKIYILKHIIRNNKKRFKSVASVKESRRKALKQSKLNKEKW